MVGVVGCIHICLHLSEQKGGMALRDGMFRVGVQQSTAQIPSSRRCLMGFNRRSGTCSMAVDILYIYTTSAAAPISQFAWSTLLLILDS